MNNIRRAGTVYLVCKESTYGELTVDPITTFEPLGDKARQVKTEMDTTNNPPNEVSNSNGKS